MPRAFRIGAIVLFLGLLAAWILRVAIVTDYHEKAILPLGGLWFLAALALSWQTRRRSLQAILVLFVTAAMVAIGSLAGSAADYQQQVRQIITRNVLEAVARTLPAFLATGKPLPEVEWTMLMPAIEGAGAWRPLTIPYQTGDRVETFLHIPRKDAWGCLYRYTKTGDNAFTLASSGADRRWNTPDDIVVASGQTLPDAPRALPVDPKRKSGK